MEPFQIINAGIAMLKHTIDISHQVNNKLIAAVKIKRFVIEDEALLAQIVVTNNGKETFAIEEIELHINDQEFPQTIISGIDCHLQSEYNPNHPILVRTDRRVYSFNGGVFPHYQIMPYQPLLKPGELASGLVLIPLPQTPGSISRLLLVINIAGVKSPFVYSINV